MQVEKITSPLPVKGLSKLTPWLVPVLLPVQVEKATVPVVPGVQATPISTPCEPESVAALVPETVIAPDVLVIPVAFPPI